MLYTVFIICANLFLNASRPSLIPIHDELNASFSHSRVLFYDVITVRHLCVFCSCFVRLWTKRKLGEKDLCFLLENSSS